ncbi:uncharacterized protein HQ_1904B [Haloquadratum walsbyi DSM 16790]|uniref:Uncharacterized protein n=1 Tax=Haloquadratum walsbyi (strain DSM 16790 / HBSQ001) TaxID=362976 RepID=A0A0C7TXN5_HALWD|nr:uncharacterized protein HQ_1904B [Haloquadratum walsbyi DSM 16790]
MIMQIITTTLNYPDAVREAQMLESVHDDPSP